MSLTIDPLHTHLMLTAAMLYVRQGFALIPLAPRTKEPAMDLLPTGPSGRPTWKPLARVPANEADVRRWLENRPDLNIGIIAGEASGGLVVLDFDRKAEEGRTVPG